jgi:hypothetical protein
MNNNVNIFDVLNDGMVSSDEVITMHKKYQRDQRDNKEKKCKKKYISVDVSRLENIEALNNMVANSKMMLEMYKNLYKIKPNWLELLNSLNSHNSLNSLNTLDAPDINKSMTENRIMQYKKICYVTMTHKIDEKYNNIVSYRDNINNPFCRAIWHICNILVNNNDDNNVKDVEHKILIDIFELFCILSRNKTIDEFNDDFVESQKKDVNNENNNDVTQSDSVGGKTSNIIECNESVNNINIPTWIYDNYSEMKIYYNKKNNDIGNVLHNKLCVVFDMDNSKTTMNKLAKSVKNNISHVDRIETHYRKTFRHHDKKFFT